MLQLEYANINFNMIDRKKSSIAMFADDTLVYDVICNSSSCCSVASNLPRLECLGPKLECNVQSISSADMLNPVDVP